MRPSASVFASAMLLATLFAAATAAASQAPIKRLSRSNWFDYVSHERTVFIQVFIPSCKHCKAMEPMWQEIANQLRARDSDVLVARLDAAADNGIAPIWWTRRRRRASPPSNRPETRHDRRHRLAL